MNELKKQIKDACELMQEVIDDRSVPRNIRNVVEQAQQKVSARKASAMDFSSAIYLLDDVSSDINMPYHTRTEIWEIISKLEAIKEKMK